MKGAFPPLTFTEAFPFAAPLQETLLWLPIDATGAIGLLINASAESLQPRESVTTTRTLPAHNPVAIAVVCPSDHKYEYGGVPPPGVAVAEALQPFPVQLAEVALAETETGAGSVIVTVVTRLHPTASSKVSSYAPGHNCVIESFTIPVSQVYVFAYGLTPLANATPSHELTQETFCCPDTTEQLQ